MTIQSSDDLMDDFHFGPSEEVSPEARRQRRWRQNNRERYLERNRVESCRARAKKLGAEGDFTLAEWLMLVAKYGGRCLACGRHDLDLTIDHIQALERGGSNFIDNIQPLCDTCNKVKKDKTIDYRKAEAAD